MPSTTVIFIRMFMSSSSTMRLAGVYGVDIGVMPHGRVVGCVYVLLVRCSLSPCLALPLSRPLF